MLAAAAEAAASYAGNGLSTRRMLEQFWCVTVIGRPTASFDQIDISAAPPAGDSVCLSLPKLLLNPRSA